MANNNNSKHKNPPLLPVNENSKRLDEIMGALVGLTNSMDGKFNEVNAQLSNQRKELMNVKKDLSKIKNDDKQKNVIGVDGAKMAEAKMDESEGGGQNFGDLMAEGGKKDSFDKNHPGFGAKDLSVPKNGMFIVAISYFILFLFFSFLFAFLFLFYFFFELRIFVTFFFFYYFAVFFRISPNCEFFFGGKQLKYIKHKGNNCGVISQ